MYDKARALYSYLVKKIPAWRKQTTPPDPPIHLGTYSAEWFKFYERAGCRISARRTRTWFACLYVAGEWPCPNPPIDLTDRAKLLLRALYENDRGLVQWLDRRDNSLPIHQAIELGVDEALILTARAWFKLPIALVHLDPVPEPTPSKFKHEMLLQISDEVRAGKSSRAIAVKYQVPLAYVHQFLRERKPKEIPPLLPEFRTYDDAAAHWGLTREQARLKLRSMGITLERSAAAVRHKTWLDDLATLSISECAKKWGVPYGTAYRRAMRLRSK